MRTGSRTFVGFSAIIIPAALIYVAVTGIKTGLIGPLIGLFLVLKFLNLLDARDIRDGRS